MQKREQFGIVGGGLLGLTLALRLAQRGFDVTVLEAADRLGGLADAWQLDDVTWDRHYHVTLLSDSYLRALLSELVLDDDMRWTKTRTGFLVAGQLYSMSSVWEFLRFPPLSLIDKLRLGWTIWHASRISDSKPLEQVPVAEWLTRHSGRRTFERIWLPLLKAKLGDAWQRTSAAFIWATIQRMYAARHSGHKHEMFGYLPGGYARIIAAFQQRLSELGVKCCTNTRVSNVVRTDGGALQITTQDGEAHVFDRVAVTTPAPVAAQTCSGLNAHESEGLRSIEYAGIICASVLLKKPLAGYYVTNITDPAPFTGIIEMTALVDPAQFGGRALVYLPKYVTANDPFWSKNDAEIRDQFVAALTRFYPQIEKDDVLAFRISRVKHVFRLSTLGYSSRVPPVETSVPGLFLVNSAQIVSSTLNVNETVRLAESAVETLCRPLFAPCTPRLAFKTRIAGLRPLPRPWKPMPQPIASLSLDLDNKWSYMKTHGDRGWEAFPSYLDVVVPRFLTLLDDLSLKITVFVVGQDAASEANHAPLREVAAAGHEIGNHSFHHEPWLHLYSPDEIEHELTAAEDAIFDATGVATTGFRGPGYSLSPAVLACLAQKGYRFDASTLPTVIGPLARSYYFFTARLNNSQRRERQRLFGSWTDGFQPLKPYWWQLGGAPGQPAGKNRFLEIPVTTLPFFRVPIHFSYLLFLRQRSPAIAWAYWRMAMRVCRMRGVEPSLLLHPLDVMGGDDEPDLGFFPAMGMPGAEKRAFVRDLLADFACQFRVLPMGAHAALIAARENLPVRSVASIGATGEPKTSAVQSRLASDLRRPVEPAMTGEAQSR